MMSNSFRRISNDPCAAKQGDIWKMAAWTIDGYYLSTRFKDDSCDLVEVVPDVLEEAIKTLRYHLGTYVFDAGLQLSIRLLEKLQNQQK